MDDLDHSTNKFMLTCQVCGRQIPPVLSARSNDSDPSTAAIPAYCPSCGGPVAPAVSTVAASAPKDPDLYQTAPVLPASPSAYAAQDADDARTQPVAVPAAIPESEPPTKLLPGGHRNPWLIIAPSLVLLILFVAGIIFAESGGQSPAPVVTPPTQPASTPTASVPDGFVRKTDENDFFSFAVPSSWVLAPSPPAPPNVEYTTYIDPPRSASFEVESFPSNLQEAGSVLDTQILQRNYPSLASADVSSSRSVKLAGETWIKETSALTLTQNGATTTQNLAVQSASFDGTTYIIFYSSPDNADAQVLQVILATFHFLG